MYHPYRADMGLISVLTGNIGIGGENIATGTAAPELDPNLTCGQCVFFFVVFYSFIFAARRTSGR